MRVLVPLPDIDFDTTEVAVPWRLLSEAGHEVVFATEHGGSAPSCDRRLLDGVLFGKLGAEPEPIAFYDEMIQTASFRSPFSWLDLDISAYDGLLLAGGHAPGCGSTSDRRSCRRPSLSSGERGSRSARSVTAYSSWRGARTPKGSASWRAGVRRACPSTWNAAAIS